MAAEAGQGEVEPDAVAGVVDLHGGMGSTLSWTPQLL